MVRHRTEVPENVSERFEGSNPSLPASPWKDRDDAMSASNVILMCPDCNLEYDRRRQSILCPHAIVVPDEFSPNTPRGKAGEAGEALPLMGFDGVAMDGVDWFWPGWLARGKTTNLSGAGGSGKGTFAAYLMACATGGRAWPDGRKTDPCIAVVVSPDDGLADTLKPRLVHSGADMSLCRRVDPVVVGAGVPAIMNSIRMDKDRAGIVVIDMMQAGMAAGTDGNSATDVVRHVAEFNRLAEDINAACIVIHHVNKWLRAKVTEGSLANLVRGSGAWTDAARMVWLLTPNENDSDFARVLVRAKCNIGGVRWYEGGYAVRSRDIEFDGDNDRAGLTTVVDDVSYIDGRAHEIFTEAVTKADNDDKAITRQDTATDALMALLKPGKPVLKQTAVAVLSSDGHAPRTIERAAQQLCHDGRVIIRKPTPDEFPGANRNAAVWEGM